MEATALVRDLPFGEVFNFRDLGGHVGVDGRTVRWRRLFRSDSLHRLAGADLAAFTALGVRTVVDLRRPAEVARDGRVPDHPGLGYHHIHPEHAEWEYLDGADVARWLADRYLALAAEGRAGLVGALRLVADGRAAPVVVHCVAGKDRTGVVIALALALLGVADADIAADYAGSTAGTDRFIAWARRVAPQLLDLPAPFLASPAEAMLLFLTDLRARHGSVQRYLAGGGFDAEAVAELRHHLLTSAPPAGAG